MNLNKMFNIDNTLARAEQAKARRAHSMQNMFTHRLPGPTNSQIYCVAKMLHFLALLPKSADKEELFESFKREEMLLVHETVIRNNRELLEFHNLDSSCPRCRHRLSECECRELLRIDTEGLQHAIHLVIKKLYMRKELAIVHMSETGLCSLHCARDYAAPSFFPAYGLGTGFNIYAEDYHLKKPSSE